MLNKRKFTISLLALCAVVLLFYFKMFNLLLPYTTWKHSKAFENRISRQKVNRQPYDGKEDYLINTPGCTIPNYMKHFQFKEAANLKGSCYERIVYVEKSSESEITFRIRNNYTKKKLRFKCGYQFVRRSNVRGKEDNNVM